jgi:hypothetical protein
MKTRGTYLVTGGAGLAEDAAPFADAEGAAEGKET